MDRRKTFKGKAACLAAPSFAIRYNAEGEELEQLYDPPPIEKTEEVKVEEKKGQDDSGSISGDGEKKGRESPFLSKLNRRAGSLEEGETWRFLTDIKGRITKTVGEKIEEISKKKKKTVDRIEVGVDVLKTELNNLRSGAVVAPVGQLDALQEAGPPGLLAALQTWAPLVFPAFLAVLYHAVDISPFLKGLLFGVMVTVEVMYLRERVISVFGKEDIELEGDTRPGTPVFGTIPVLTEATFYTPNPSPEVVLHEGWMNEFCDEYDPAMYHIALTSSAYVRLEGSWLRIGSTKQRIRKRAFWNEATLKPFISHERAYSLEGSQVILLPQGLAHKRLWSKKYPICIKLSPGALIGVRGITHLVDEKTSVTPEPETSEKLKETVENNSAKKTDELTKKIDEQEVGNETLDTLSEPESTSTVASNNNRPTDEEEQEEEGIADDEEEFDSEFVQVPETLVNRNYLYLFARTDREKEIWFRRFIAAVDCKNTLEGSERETRLNREQNYLEFMKRIGQVKPSTSKSRHKLIKKEGVSDTWVNTIVGRIMYDVLQEPFWLNKIQEKIQRKLSAIKIPVFMEELVVSSLEFGDSIPVIERSSEPLVNEHGLWIDLDLSYKGSFSMTVDTKINIMKLKSPPPHEPYPSLQTPAAKPAIFDSGAEDSAESSSDEPTITRAMSGAPPKKKMMRVVDKIAASKYFQQVTDNKYVKRALEGVSNTNISLIVEVKGLVGTLVLNVPPPPSNRLWYGFRAKPELILAAQPKWGERTINMLNMTSWIEKKLIQEFHKVLVLPNMDDLVVPVMPKDLPS